MGAPVSQQPGLSIVIPTWNGCPLLEKFLPTVVEAAAAFEAACRQPTELIVVDDASRDDTLEWLAARYPQVRLEANEEQRGFAPTANRGVASARYAWVYLLNNDVALAPASLPPLVEHWADGQVFAVASAVYDYASGVLSGAGQVGEWRRGFLGIHRRYFVPEARSPRHDARPWPSGHGFSRAEEAEENKGASAPEVPPDARPWLTLYAGGASSLFNREKFLVLGGFEEMLAPFGWEDVELSLRAWKRGYEVRYEPRSAVWHQFSSTIAPRFARRRVRAIYARNRLLTHWLHLDTPAEFATHAAFLLLKLLASPFVARWETWSAFAQALRRLREVHARRKRLRSVQQRRLRDVLALVAGELHRPEAKPLTAGTAPIRPFPQARPARAGSR